jgi:hypothetical protein
MSGPNRPGRQGATTLERVRLVGGDLQGEVMWVETGAPVLDVHIGGQSPGTTRTLHYRRSGAVLRFVGETRTPTLPDARPG